MRVTEVEAKTMMCPVLSYGMDVGSNTIGLHYQSCLGKKCMAFEKSKPTCVGTKEQKISTERLPRPTEYLYEENNLYYCGYIKR